MFTGIIQALGVTANVWRVGDERRFYFRALLPGEPLVEGESIAINGVCLSVENFDANGFVAFASRETLSRTNLGELRAGTPVNLERALAVGDRLGGHFVSGHIDCLATLIKLEKAGQSFRYRFNFPSEYAAQVVEKGSIALDGISLTINAAGANFLEVNVIPDSQKRTNISSWKPGAKINMETDLLGKYVVNYLNIYPARSAENSRATLDRETLARLGFV